MTRLKPKFLDRIRGAFSEVDKKFGTGHDVNDSKIKELEDQMGNGIIDVNKNLGISNQRNLNKKMRKSHKGLR